MSTKYQPRYVAYAQAHGKTPEQMLEHDEIEWPGGRMCGFVLWISSQWRAWAKSVGGMPPVLAPEHHASFNTFVGA